MRLRILFGSLAILAGLIVYAALAMAVLARLPQNAALDFGFYALAGIAWLAPAALVTRWMVRAPPYRPPPTT